MSNTAIDRRLEILDVRRERESNEEKREEEEEKKKNFHCYYIRGKK
jgi:hypothetical protein